MTRLRLCNNYIKSRIEENKAFATGHYMFKVNNRNTTSRCSNLTVKTPKRRQLCRSCISIVNFEYISHLVFLCVDFEQENIGWVIYKTNRLICFLASKIQNKYYENLKNKEHKITIKNFFGKQ